MALTNADFQSVVERHGPALYRLAYRLMGDAHDAEEIVQETLRSAWTSRDRFDSTRGERAWLASILRRRVVDRWRHVGRTPPTASGDHVLDAPAAEFDPLAHEYTDAMQQALDLLPGDMREALLLVVVGELTHQETAEALGTPLGTILSRVSRGRAKLRESLLAIEARHRGAAPMR
ncbi:MAG: RNA polymerase sigma factor [Lacipirellulaceae bacterium]